MNPGKVAFRKQFRFGLQPMLNLVAGLRALVHISEIGLSGHLIP